MLMLQHALPKEIRPYSLTTTNSDAASQMITSIVFKNLDTLITGSRDRRVSWNNHYVSCIYQCEWLISTHFQVKFFNTADLSETNCLTLSDTVLDISVYGGSHVILGSTSIQLVDIESPEKRRTIADDLHEDENLNDPPLHVVQFGPKGRMATASVESNTVKLWPQVPHISSHNTHPESRLHVGDSVGSIYKYVLLLICIDRGEGSTSWYPAPFHSPDTFLYPSALYVY